MRTETKVDSAKTREIERKKSASLIAGRAEAAGVFSLLFALAGISGLSQTGGLMAAALMPIVLLLSSAMTKAARPSTSICAASALASAISVSVLSRAFAELTDICFLPILGADLASPLICALAFFAAMIWRRGAAMACGFTLFIFLIMLALSVIECFPRFEPSMLTTAGFPTVPPLAAASLLIVPAPIFAQEQAGKRAGYSVFGWGLFMVYTLISALLLPLMGFNIASVFSGAGEGWSRAALPCALASLLFCSAASLARSSAYSLHSAFPKAAKWLVLLILAALSAALSVFKELLPLCASASGALLLLSAGAKAIFARERRKAK